MNSQDPSDQGNQDQDTNGEEEGGREPGEVGTHSDEEGRETELPKEPSNNEQEEDSTQSDTVLEESYQPTQESKMQKEELEQGSREQKEGKQQGGNGRRNCIKIGRPVKIQNGRAKKESLALKLSATTRRWIKKTLSEPLLVEPTDTVLMPWPEIMGPRITAISS